MKKLIFSFVLLGNIFVSNLFGWYPPGPEYDFCLGKCESKLGNPKDKSDQSNSFFKCMEDCMGPNSTIARIFLFGGKL